MGAHEERMLREWRERFGTEELVPVPSVPAHRFDAMLRVRLGRAQFAWVRARAAAAGMSVSAWCRRAILADMRPEVTACAAECSVSGSMGTIGQGMGPVGITPGTRREED